MPLIFLNGKFVPEAQAMVSVLDRGFLYGDGLFETLRVYRGNPFCWDEHIERLKRGAAFLKINLPFPPNQLRQDVLQLIERNQMPEALLRITLSRGVGLRGYSPKGANHPTLVMSLHSAPDAGSERPLSWNIVTASFRLPANESLAQFKTCNKLPQILARAEAEAAGADEALLLNTNDEVVEASTSNLFWIANDTVCTAPLASGILAGVTRVVVLELCRELKLPARECSITVTELERTQGIFLSLSSVGIVEAVTLNTHPLARSPHVKILRDAYEKRVCSFRE